MSGSLQPPRVYRIDQLKITAYLLNPVHPVGGAKALFFVRHGFCRTRPGEFETALLLHPLTASLVKTENNGFADKFIFEGELGGPNGPIPRVRSVWKRNAGIAYGELVTAYAF